MIILSKMATTGETEGFSAQPLTYIIVFACCHIAGLVFDFSIRLDYALLDLDSDSISIPNFDFDSGFDSDLFRLDRHLKNQVDILAREPDLEFVLMERSLGKRSGDIETGVLHRISIQIIWAERFGLGSRFWKNI